MATFKHNMPACATCACAGSGTSCGAATACVSFIPACSAITGASVSLTWTPDSGATPATVTGSSNSLCVAQSQVPGTLSWTFSSTNYLSTSGSVHITTCFPATTNVSVFPNTYKVCVQGCNILTDGTSVTVTASGSVSGSCTPTLTTVPGVGAALCCTFSVSSPVTVAPTITVLADRYQIASIAGTVNCQQIVQMQAATGYFCCDPTGTWTCKPIKTSLSLTTPVGTFNFSLGTGGTPAVTATVPSIGPVTIGGVVQSGCGAPGGTPAPTNNAVTFFLTLFTCSSGGFGGTISYSGCPYPTNGPCTTDTEAQADDHCCQNTITGSYQFSLSGTCPPGQIGTFASEVCHNRYLSGAGYNLTEV